MNDFKEFMEERFTKRVLFKEGESTVFVLNFLEGQKLPEHTHPGTELYLLVLNGNGTLTINGEDTHVSTNDVIHCHGDEKFSFKNTGKDPVSLYVMLNKVPNKNYAQDM